MGRFTAILPPHCRSVLAKAACYCATNLSSQLHSSLGASMTDDPAPLIATEHTLTVDLVFPRRSPDPETAPHVFVKGPPGLAREQRAGRQTG